MNENDFWRKYRKLFLSYHLNQVNEWESVDELREIITKINERQLIRHEVKFGAITNNDDIFVIQVHNRSDYLKILIDSLGDVRGIEKALLIFSHDLFEPKINEIIRNITFCKVMQIFFPFSKQLYPDSFPGDECIVEQGNTTRSVNCTESQYTNSAVKIRDAKYQQIKHHWFWKLNYVFEGLRVTRNFTGYLTFLEDDYFLLADSIYVLKALKSNCGNCDMLSLGKRLRNFSTIYTSILLSTVPDDVSTISINRHFFLKFKNYSKQFCAYNDYNHDWSMKYIFLNRMNSIPVSLTAQASRVYHIGDCGFHYQEEDCFESFRSVQEIVNTCGSFFFPESFSVTRCEDCEINFGGPYGGWNDARDHSLCLSFTNYGSHNFTLPA
ncbi:alpha-1:6-mannosyl-glycoprotein 2-beta-N-acetylglucosaminyltransferase-like protein [Leptotrombidium deliense]|uniref:Alpha-1,6-mannosyl-glycoprotein 2-beta-N-acetylglucosaminyltransferase n=1 Tax=Leptotrombidium deliense TaxID=299467 RepID=A0A443SCS2_9ACAR|nr:alpha-1:6-mannosyl-glycoprotein 2-beta-N-acetylglucosaminyltransferase-like protein [Leptotrombidium deliense]